MPTVFDRYPVPPAAALLGWQLVEIGPLLGRLVVRFDGKREFTNPAGFIQGGLLTAMLDDCMGPAVLAMTDGALYTSTIDMTVSFIAPARPGPITGEGMVVNLGRTIAFLEGRLTDADGKLLAKASASARLTPTERAVASREGG